jgi:hypothetical protein
MEPLKRAKVAVGEAIGLTAALRLGLDKLCELRDAACSTVAKARRLRRVSAHDLMPLDLAARTVFRRVYEEKMLIAIPARQGTHLDGLAYAIAELAPLYTYEGNGITVRPLSEDELRGALFEGGAKVIRYADGRAPIEHIAVNAKTIQAVIRTLICGGNLRADC